MLVLLIPLIVLFSKPYLYSGIKLKILDCLRLPLKIIHFPLKESKKVIFYRFTAKENENLKNQVDALKRRLVNQEEILKENERLRRLLFFKNQATFSLIAATVIARDPSNWESVVIIDKGRNDGVSINMSVITELGLVGKISEVASNTSKISCLNDPGFSVAALLQRNREQGVVTGTINGFCRMKYLSIESDAKPKDIVVTSGLSKPSPKGILIGEVIEAEEDLSGLTKNCLIKPAVNLDKLEEVLVIVNQ
ncbi:MAG: rod shape-determining protein MreC [Candidatus Omnitrophota bacterium]|nr:rod shape-determining protein MreC [Candidatus Omnitrophota bacterium]